MSVDLFAGICVADLPVAMAWYERLFGSPPTFVASDTEAVWELAEHRSVFVEHPPEHAGHALHTVFVDDLDALVAGIADRGLEPARRETYAHGVRKVTYQDPEGNESGFGGAPCRARTARATSPPAADPPGPCRGAGHPTTPSRR
ncbi:VOC family protein [Streptomyces sp. NPDC005899]|uniref:VOC family protein n=1 Tax=Streptomyces sp. NPDC005899 TaxID=3155716 RepID=UPI0033C21EE3